jgi:hypothetical protein
LIDEDAEDGDSGLMEESNETSDDDDDENSSNEDEFKEYEEDISERYIVI